MKISFLNTIFGNQTFTGFEDRFQKEASLSSSAVRPSLVKVTHKILI